MLLWTEFIDWLNSDSSRKKNLPHWEGFIADVQKVLGIINTETRVLEKPVEIDELIGKTWGLTKILLWESQNGRLFAYLEVLEKFLQQKGTVVTGSSLYDAKKIYELFQEKKELKRKIGDLEKLNGKKRWNKMKLKLREWIRLIKTLK